MKKAIQDSKEKTEENPKELSNANMTYQHLKILDQWLRYELATLHINLAELKAKVFILPKK